MANRPVSIDSTPEWGYRYITTSLRLDLGFIGFTAYLFSLFLALFSPALVVVREGLNLINIFSMILFFVGMCGIYLVAAIIPKVLLAKTGRMIVLIAPIVIAALYALIVNLSQMMIAVPDPLFVAVWFLEGAAIGCMCLEMALFFNLLYHQKRGERAGFYAVFGVMLAALLLMLFDVDPGLCSILLCVSTSITQYSLLAVPIWSQEQRLIGRRPLALTSKYRHITFGLTLFGLIIGTMAAYRYVSDTLMRDSIWTVALSLSVGGIIFGLIWVILRDKASIVLTQWMLLPIPILGLLLVPLVDNEWRILITIILLGFYMCYDIANLLAIANMAYNANATVLRLTGISRSFGMFGTIVGWFLSLFFLSRAYENSIMAGYSVVIVFALVLGLFIVNRPKEATRADRAGKWKQQCEWVCETYGLSPRESEVFMLLAKSRNAQSIEQELNISNHTARTHINHIYRKLGIHRHQELIDLIESQARMDLEQRQIKSL
jgi:DNA-binding CsgD family transcriptional regulator